MIAIIERDAAVVNHDGIDVVALNAYREKHGHFDGFTGGAVIKEDPKKYLELECDILVPAALEKQITMENMGRIRAKIIAEGANGPTTPGLCFSMVV